jgi:putative ATP-dependent endonuclease of OLD family
MKFARSGRGRDDAGQAFVSRLENGSAALFLKGLRIENFRAVRQTSIAFDNSTALIGENDCGISSVLDALELVLGFEEKHRAFPPWIFHRLVGSGQPSGPVRIRLRFSERHPGEWAGEEYEPFRFLLPEESRRRREIWYETRIQPGGGDNGAARYRLRSPGSGERTSDPDLIGRFRRMNPVIRVSAGMLTGHGETFEGIRDGRFSEFKVSPEMRDLMGRISRAVESRLSGTSLNLKKDLDDGFQAARALIERSGVKLGKWETGLARSVTEILGWTTGHRGEIGSAPFQDPDTAPERLGILLLIGALLRAWPGGMAPDADPLWVIEEPEAHLHPMTLTSVAMFVRRIQRQRIFTTYSGDLLSAVPLSQVRRLVRHDGLLHERRVRKNALSRSEMRRFHYHLRTRVVSASFARLWLLVEGESEFWILPQLARLMGYEFALEGIACIEFAQCGLDPPIKVARELGIEWHLLADGDDAGRGFADRARSFLGNEPPDERVTRLPEKDIERCFWTAGYDGVYRKHAGLSDAEAGETSPGKIIRAAVRRRSKPFLALSVVEAITRKDSNGIPPVLQEMIHTCVDLARRSPLRLRG